MPNEQSFAHYKRYMETRVCACGKHEDQHVGAEADIPFQADPPCKLTRALVATWNMIPRQGSALPA